MSLKTTIETFLTTLRTITVTNQDGGSTSLYAALYNNQPEREQEGGGYFYPKPAVFIEPKFGESKPIGGGVTAIDITWSILLVHEFYNVEGTFDNDTTIYDLRDKVHRVCNLLDLPSCNPLIQTGISTDVNHKNVNYLTLEYSCGYIDLTGSPYDELYEAQSEETLVNPALNIGEQITTTINESTTNTQATYSFESINSVSNSASGSILTITVNDAYSFEIDTESTQTVSIDWGDGNTDEVAIKQAISHDFRNANTTYTITMTMNYGAELKMQIRTDGSGNIVGYYDEYQQSTVYDLSIGLNPDYPYYNSVTVSNVNGIFKSFKGIDFLSSTTKTAIYTDSQPFKYNGVMAPDSANIIYSETLYSYTGYNLSITSKTAVRLFTP